MYHVNTQGVDERMINVHYYYGPTFTYMWVHANILGKVEDLLL